MDKTPERNEDYERELQKKIEISMRAGAELKNRILQKDDFTEEEALGFAVEYVARKIEVFTLGEDMLTPEEFEEMKGEEDKQEDDPRRKAELVLFEAQRGNYRHLKNYLLDYGKEIKKTQKDLSDKLIILSSKIQKEGSPVRLPIFAWMDPKYNPDAMPLPPQVDSK